MGKRAVTSPKKTFLRDPNNPDEKELQRAMEDLSNQLWWAWLLGKPNSGIKEIALRARLRPKTVENYVHGLTRRPSLGTFIRIAFAVGYRVTLVRLNASLQREEIEIRHDANDRLLKSLKRAQKRKR